MRQTSVGNNACTFFQITTVQRLFMPTYSFHLYSTGNWINIMFSSITLWEIAYVFHLEHRATTFGPTFLRWTVYTIRVPLLEKCYRSYGLPMMTSNNDMIFLNLVIDAKGWLRMLAVSSLRPKITKRGTVCSHDGRPDSSREKNEQ